MTENTSLPIVIDHGSTTTRVGFAGQQDPCTIFATVVGYEKNDSTKYYVGNEVLAKNNLLIKKVVSGGLIHNWDDIETFWKYMYKEQLCVDSQKHPVLITEPPFNFKSHRAKVTQIFFENFNVPALNLVPNVVLALFASGRTTGIVFTSGGEVCTTYAVPIYEGHAIPSSTLRIPCLGGDTLTESLRDMLMESYPFMSSINLDIVRDIKEKVCYIALDFEHEMASKLINSETYKLPDGRTIEIGKERFKCAEGLFQPKILQQEFEGIHSLICNSIMKSDETIRNTLFSNIVLYGGPTMISGIQVRLQKEIVGLASTQKKVKVIAPADRNMTAWYGGALVASMPQFLNTCISRDEYNEFGPNIVHRKCF